MKLSKNFTDSQSIFVHIPKAAGNSLAIGLYGLSFGHYTAYDYYRDNMKEWEKLFSFTVVRDPLDRFLSAYNFLKIGGINKYDMRFSNKHLLKTININKFIDKFFDNIKVKFYKPYIHFIPQNHFIIHKKYKYSLISKVYRFESLEDSYKDIVRDIRLINPNFIPMHYELPKINKTKTAFSGKTSIDEISDENIKRIKNYYYDDYQMFGYI